MISLNNHKHTRTTLNTHKLVTEHTNMGFGSEDKMMGRNFFGLKNLSIKIAGSNNVGPNHDKRADVTPQTTTLLVPGLGGSGPKHWQSRWQQSRPGCSFVKQNNWNLPDCQAWLTGLDAAIRACPTPPIVVAHSLGCALVAHWAAHTTTDTLIQGALLVAPADVDSDLHTPPETKVFAPMPMTRLAFPATVVASTTDSYVDVQRAQVFATAWGAEFVNIGAHGHINADSRLDDWDEGWRLLDDLMAPTESLSIA